MANGTIAEDVSFTTSIVEAAGHVADVLVLGIASNTVVSRKA